MFSKTKVNEGLRLEAAGLRPSSLKHWWKIATDEDTSGTTLIDVVNGANFQSGSNAYVSAGIFNPANANGSPLTSGSYTSVGTNNFLFMINADVDAFGGVGLGDPADNRIRFGDGVITQTEIVGASATVGSLDNIADTSGAKKTHLLWYDGTDAHSKIDTGTTNDTTGDPGAITLLTDIVFAAIPAMTGMALFVFDGAVPSDLVTAGLFMGDCWENNNKCLYPTNVAEWGTWS